MTFPSRELAVHCARLVDQKGGEDVVVLQLPATAHSFDFAVLVTAGSDRLTNALVEEVWHFCKRHQVPRMPVEGESGWMLIDCYDVVVHALSTEKREYYQLDTLWSLARKVDWAKEAKALPDPDKAPAAEAEPAQPKRSSRAKKIETAEEEAEVEVETPKPKKAGAKAKAAIKPKKATTAKLSTAKPAAAKKRKPASRAKRQQGDE